MSVAPPAAEAHAVRLIQLPTVRAVVSLKEPVFHTLHSKIQSPVLPVDSDIDIAAQGCIHAEISHHTIDKIVLHHGVVLNQIVQTQLVQTMIGLSVFILVKLQLEAVALAAHRADRTQRGISLRPDADVSVALAVDHHCAGAVFFTLTSLDKSIPVIHHNVHGMYEGGVEELVLIAHVPACGNNAERGSAHEQKTQQQRDHEGGNADFVDMSVC